jgi:hypothetical protein
MQGGQLNAYVNLGRMNIIAKIRKRKICYWTLLNCCSFIFKYPEKNLFEVYESFKDSIDCILLNA